MRQKGLRIPVTSFDGQFSKEALRGPNMESLTILQLMKDVWKKSARTDVWVKYGMRYGPVKSYPVSRNLYFNDEWTYNRPNSCWEKEK